MPSVRPDWALDGLFYGQVGPGWVAGDATYSTAMPGRREAFVFSDTVIGTASVFGGAAVSGVAANSELVGRPPNLRSAYGGTYRSPAPLIPDRRHPGDEWEVAATLEVGGRQLVFVNEFAPVPGSQFGRFTGRSGVAELTAPASGTPRFERVVALPTSRGTQWGNALVVRHGVAYVYGVDGNTATGAFGGMTLARVRVADVARPARWRYWDGRRWRAGERHATALATGQALTGVAVQPGRRGLVAVSIPSGVTRDSTVDLSYACEVSGPWSPPVPVYAIPQLVEYQHETAYMATFHPELSSRGSLVVSYDIDTTDGLFAVAADVHRYQPQFLIVRP
ncbi:MAG: DUF4185 domain-containing protein [Acidimicrobiales bacterium]